MSFTPETTTLLDDPQRSRPVGDDEFDALLDASTLGDPTAELVRWLTPARVRRELDRQLADRVHGRRDCDPDDALLHLVRVIGTGAHQAGGMLGDCGNGHPFPDDARDDNWEIVRARQASLLADWQLVHDPVLFPSCQSAPAGYFWGAHLTWNADRHLQMLVDRDAISDVREEVARKIVRFTFRCPTPVPRVLRDTCMSVLDTSRVGDDLAGECCMVLLDIGPRALPPAPVRAEILTRSAGPAWPPRGDRQLTAPGKPATAVMCLDGIQAGIAQVWRSLTGLILAIIGVLITLGIGLRTCLVLVGGIKRTSTVRYHPNHYRPHSGDG